MSTADVIVVGAGPSGAVAATILARAGARVRLLDRARFPRDKLCGDNLNPGALALLRRLEMARDLEGRALRIDGMLLTGAGGVSIEGRYPNGLSGLSIRRRDLDWMLLRDAIAAGAVFEDRVAVRGAVLNSQAAVTGVTIGVNGSSARLEAPVVIAADGRHSTIGFGLGLASHPAAPRRWAIGVYFESCGAASRLGEMHVRPGRYIGVAPVPDGLTNVCLVKPSSGGDVEFRDPLALLKREIEAEPMLRDRFAGRDPVCPPALLGPLAVNAANRSVDGLILTGDAAGFIDPMTGDGLRFAIRGGELAASAALQALSHGWTGVHARLADDRHREFASKIRFNRAIRTLVDKPVALGAASLGRRIAPGVLRAVISKAGDCDVASPR